MATTDVDTNYPGANDPDADARRLSAQSYAAGDPTGWFERLYAEAYQGTAIVPWDSRVPHPLLTEWAEHTGVTGGGRTAVVVGCGLGDDAEFVAGLGFTTTAFDLSASAVAGARRRFPDSTVHYTTADLLNPPADWQDGFDLVVEIMTVQSLPQPLHPEAIRRVAELVASGGRLLVIGMARAADQEPAAPPWPLTRAEVESFAAHGVVSVQLDELRTDHRHRWRALFERG